LKKLYEPELAEKITSATAQVESARLKLAELNKGPDQDEITKAEAALSQKKIALKQAQWAYDQVAYRGDVGAMPQADELQQATLDYEAAQADYNLAVRGPTGAELAEARAALASSQANLAELLQSPSSADIAAKQAAVDQARLTLKEKQRNLEQAVLVAPIDGLITEVNIEPGERALNEETKAAIVLANTSAYLLKVEVDEIDIGRVRQGQTVAVNLDAIGDKEFQGQVVDIAPRPVKMDDANAIVTYEVVISLADDEPSLLTGMSATASIEVERLEQVLVLPNQAIQIDQDSLEPMIYVEKLDDQDNLIRAEVELGLHNGTVTQVLAGVNEGERVVVRNQADFGLAPAL
jgi:HlyD family secretion protein